jgi:hypothetical protein
LDFSSLNLKHYLGAYLLGLLLMVGPEKSVGAAISHFTDARGTIHIFNDPKTEDGRNNPDSDSPDQLGPIAAITPREPTPSNIFPEPEAPVVPAYLTAEPQASPESGSPPPESELNH